MREKHHEQRKLLGSGVDPMARRKGGKQAEKRRSEEVFANVAELWIEHWREGKSARHVDATARRLATNILPSLGLKQITEVSAPEVVAMVRAIDSRGARDVAKRALETTGRFSGSPSRTGMRPGTSRLRCVRGTFCDQPSARTMPDRCQAVAAALEAVGNLPWRSSDSAGNQAARSHICAYG